MADVKLPSRDVEASSERAGTGFRSDPRKMTAEKSAPMAPRAQGTRSDPKSRPAVFSRGEDGTVTFSSKGDGYLYSFDPATNQFTILESPDGRGVGAKIGADHSMAKNFQEAMDGRSRRRRQRLRKGRSSQASPLQIKLTWPSRLQRTSSES